MLPFEEILTSSDKKDKTISLPAPPCFLDAEASAVFCLVEQIPEDNVKTNTGTWKRQSQEWSGQTNPMGCSHTLGLRLAFMHV